MIIGLVVCVIAKDKNAWLVQACYAAAVVGSIMTAAKVVPIIEGYNLFASVAVGLYAMTFLFADFLGEIYDRKAAVRGVLMGLAVALIVVSAVQFSIYVDPAPFWYGQEAYQATHNRSLRILIASILAFSAAQFVAVHLFDWLKEKMDGKYLGLRNNVSTFIGQTIDSVVFFTIGFWGEVPDLLGLIVVSCAVKYAVAICDTPIIYLARHIAIGHKSEPADGHHEKKSHEMTPPVSSAPV